MGSGFSSFKSEDAWAVRKSKKIYGKATKSLGYTTCKELGSGFSSSSSRDEGAGRKYNRNEGNKRRVVDSTMDINMDCSIPSLGTRDEVVHRNSKRNEVTADEKMEKRFKRRRHPTKAVDSGKQRFVNESKKIEDSSIIVDEKMEKKYHPLPTKTIDSKSHGELEDVCSSLWSRIKRADKKLKNKMTSPVDDGKKENKSKAKLSSAATQLRIGLDMCSKRGDVMGAISLYDSALREGTKLGQYHYNVLLYLCSSAAMGVIQPAKSGSGSSRNLDKMNSTSTLSSEHISGSSEIRQIGDENINCTELKMPISNGFSVELVENYGPSSGKRGRLPSDLSENSRCSSDEMTSHSSGLIVGSNRNDEEATLNKKDTMCPNEFALGTCEVGSAKSNDGIQVSDKIKTYALTRGFEIYENMCMEKIPLSEAALTSVARMAMSIGNGDMAFEMVKQMKALGINPRLRSYGPALFTFCSNEDIKKAFEVERHMLESGVHPEEPELEALLRLSVSARRGEKVYYLLHKLRTSVRKVSPSTADLIEKWFMSSSASRVGKQKWDRMLILQAMENGGGGWHGLGWLGKGKWRVIRTSVGADGVCGGCGEKLATIDLDPIETENFAKSVAAIAGKREHNSSFQTFQKWLDYHGPFEAVVDAANVGLFSQRRLSLSKVNAVANGIRQKLPSKKWPLIILHNRHISGGKMDEPANKKLIEKWKNADALYATPTGSNDDWYWLYAAIKFKCLIVTNDEMRDHIFQILGNDFFPKWKERHQVHFSFCDGSPEFHMPPQCSVVIQESEKGHWHIPIVLEQESKRERTWLCVTRGHLDMKVLEPSIKPKETYSLHRVESAGLDAVTCNQIKLSHGGEKVKQKMYRYARKTQPVPKFPSYHTIISKINAAEKHAGCVIDFQI